MDMAADVMFATSCCTGDPAAAVRPADGRGDATCQPQTKRRRIFSGGCGSKRRSGGGAGLAAAAPGDAATPCTAQGRSRRCQAEAAAAASAGAGSLPLAALAGGPYFTVASWLDAADLCRADAACRLLLALNGLPAGPWHAAGDRAYFGMELDVGGGFLAFDQDPSLRPRSSSAASSSSFLGLASWKARCRLFYREAPTFSPPFSGSEIVNVEHPDEVAYCRCRLRADLLAGRQPGVYVEVEVLANADNLSLAVVDFEGGGRSSVTFSPETGAVLRERKVRESPRAIEGTYIHLLPAAPPGRRFEGAMGLYLAGGHLAFFRRWAGEGGAANEEEPWETTGFCTDLRWAQGPRLSMCLAFRDDGAYRVRVARVGRTPPSQPAPSGEAYQEEKWSLLYGDDDHPLAI